MYIPGSSTSGEKLRYKWSKEPPAPKQWRLYIIDNGVQHVKESIVTQESNIERSQEEAVQRIDRLVYPDSVADTPTKPGKISFNMKEGNPPSKVLNSNETGPVSSENDHKLQMKNDALRRIEDVHGGQQNAK